MSRRAEAVALVAIAALACTKPSTHDDTRPAVVAKSAESRDAASVGAGVEAGAAPLPARAAFDPEPYLAARPRTGKSIGNTSVVFKLELVSGKKAAFKPASRRGPVRYKGEVAAYRLAQALGLPNVPPALARTFTRTELEAALGSESAAGKLLATEVLLEGDRVHGALIPWIERLEMLPLEADPLWTRWRAWVKHGHTFEAEDDTALGKLAGLGEAGRREVAAQASTLVAFELLTANWDRWSGANIGWDKEQRTVLFIDNDGAFFEKPPKDALAKNQRLLEGVERFSRAFVARVRALDDEALARAIGEERPGVPLLAPNVLEAIATRRKALLAAIDAKVAKNGESATFAFP